MIGYREVLGVLAILIAIAGYVPYFRNIANGKTKPHAFSWFIWGVLTGIAFFAQVSANGGPGTWFMGLTALACLTISFIAIFKGEKGYTRSDWVSLFGALIALVLWRVTDDPLSAVVLITVIDTLGFLPTIRKAYHKPHEETATTFALSAVKSVIGIIALESLTPTTWLYPASLVLMNGLFVAMIIVRRKRLDTVKPQERQSYFQSSKSSNNFRYPFYIILSLVVVVLILLFVRSFIFHAKFDEVYFSSLIDGLIPNVLSIFFAVFLVDFFIRRGSRQSTKDNLRYANRRIASGVETAVNLLAINILIFFEELSVKEVTLPKEDMTFRFAMDKFAAYTDEQINELVNKKFIVHPLRVAAYDDFKKMITERTSGIEKMLNDVYPAPDVETAEFFGELTSYMLGNINALVMVANIPNSANFIKEFKKTGEGEAEREKFHDSLIQVLGYIAPDITMILKYWRRLALISQKAKANEIFLEVVI